MKKHFLFLRVFLFYTAAVFCEEVQQAQAPQPQESKPQAPAVQKIVHDFVLSAGAGADFSALFDIEHIGNTTTPYATISGGPFLFFDATYAVFELDMLWGKYQSAYYPWDPNDGSISVCHLGFSLYGKYPFTYKRFSVFPMLGIKYNLFLYGQEKDHYGDNIGGRLSRGSSIGGGKSASALFDRISIAAGCGFDIPLVKKLFLRTEMLLNYTFMNEIERDNSRYSDKFHYDYWDAAFGFDIKVSAGWRF